MCWDALRKCCRPIPQRAVVATMVMSGLAMQYVHRLAFNLALTVMAVKLNVSEEFSKDQCQFESQEEAEERESEASKAEFDWDSNQRSTLLSAFFFGYLFTQVPGGLLADVYGPKRVMGYGVLISGVLSIITPVCARINVYLLAVVRVLMGFAQGPAFPSISTFVARWSLPNERNLMSAFMSAGVVLGSVLSSSITGYLLHHMSSWDSTFYIYGGVSLIWYVIWYLLAHESPTSHPFISDKEREKINELLKDEVGTKTKLKVPYGAIMTSMPVWAMIIGNLGHEWAFMIIVVMLPQYMSLVLQYNVQLNGLLNSLPTIAMVIVSLASAKVAEIIVRKGWMSKTLQCKTYLFIANVGPSALFVWATYAGCQRALVVALFVISMGIMGMIYSCVRIVNVDMAPNFAGFLMSLLNGIGSIGSFLVPYAFDFLTQANTVSSWRVAFIMSSVFTTLTTFVFLIWGTSKLQPWNNVPGPQATEEDATRSSNPNTTNET